MSVEYVTRSNDPGPSVRTRQKHTGEGSGNGGLFWWTIGLIILSGVAIFSWVFCLYVFSYPDKPFNYDLLTRLEKLEPPMDFKIMEVPSGPQLTAKEIYREYYQMEPDLQRVKNGDLLRAYL